jgi:hypothetical protein
MQFKALQSETYLQVEKWQMAKLSAFSTGIPKKYLRTFAFSLRD